MNVLFAFGPNLGALGAREPERYGTATLEEIMRGVSERALDFSRQTGGLRLIASTRAVGDRDLHESFPRDGKSILDAA